MNITELLTDLAAGTNGIIRSTASKFSLTASQAFHLLSIPYDGIPMSDLALRLGLDNSTLTRNVQKLEGLGLIGREHGTYELSKGPEMCAVLGPKNPTTKAHMKKVVKEESKLDINKLCNDAIASIQFPT